MNCDEARRRLRAAPDDPRASRHLERCAACFEALEAADPLAGALRAARPADQPAPDSLASQVVARWRPDRSPLRRVARGAGVAAIVALALAVELLVGAEPGRVAGLRPLATALAGAAGGLLATLQAVRAVLVGAPLVLSVLSAVTVALCALWLELALRIPAWRTAR